MKMKPSIKPNTRVVPQRKSTAGSSKKKSGTILFGDESKFLAKPLVFGAAAIKSLRINKEQAQAEAETSRRANDAGANANRSKNDSKAEEISQLRKAEMLMEFFKRQPSDDSIPVMPVVTRPQTVAPPRPVLKSQGRNSGASSTRKSTGRSSRYRIRSVQEPEPEEDFRHFTARVLNRTATKTGLDPKIQDAMIKLDLGRSLYQSEPSFTKTMVGPKKVGFHDPRVGAVQPKPATTDDDDNQTKFQNEANGTPFEVTFGGTHNLREIEDAAVGRSGDEDFMVNFRKRNSELKKFIHQKNKEFQHQAKRQERGLFTPDPGAEPKYRNPLLPSEFERDPERYMNRKQTGTGGRKLNAAELTKEFPLNFDEVVKSTMQRVHPIPGNDAGHMVKHANRLLEKSANLQPKTDFAKKVEDSHHILAQHNLLIHQSKRDVVKAPLKSTQEPPKFDPELDELQYEPLKGVGEHGPVKLLEILKAKREHVLRNGVKPQDGDDHGLGAGWAEILAMNSSTLDDALNSYSKSSTSRPPGLSTPAVAAAKIDKTNAKTPTTPHKMDQGQEFKDGQDYYFKAHPPFMQMVENPEDSGSPPGQSQQQPQFHMGMGTRKMEIKTATSTRGMLATMADVLYRPPPGHQLLAAGSLSRTPSGLDELDIRAKIKGKQLRQRVEATAAEISSNVVNLGSESQNKHESAKERQQRIKTEKDDQIMQYLRNRPDNIRLFSAGPKEYTPPPFTAARGRTPATRNR